MNRFSHDNLFNLLSKQTGPCVTIYLQLRQPYWSIRNLVRYSRLLKDAEQELLLGYSKTDAKRILSPIRFFSSLYRDLKDANTVCFFSSSSAYGFFPVKDVIPNTVVVANSFHVKPIASYLNPMDFWLGIEVTHDYIQFVKGHNRHIEPVRRVSREKWAKNGNANSSVELMQQWMSLHRRSSQTPVFVYGKKHLLEPFVFSDDVNTVPLSPGETIEEHLVNRVGLVLSYKKEKKIIELNYKILRKETTSDLNIIAKALEMNSIESLAICIDKTRWGQVDWQNGVVRTSQTGALLDCVLDDLAERALVNKLELILCKREDLAYDYDAVATLKSTTAKQEKFDAWMLSSKNNVFRSHVFEQTVSIR